MEIIRGNGADGLWLVNAYLFVIKTIKEGI